jgi:hypothetical protein
MSDVENVNEREYMVDDFYSEPFDIIKYLRVENTDEFVDYIISLAIDFYEENEYSPIIEQQKEDRFVVDYYFLVDCLSKFIEKQVMEETGDEKIVKNVRRKFKNDFTETGDSFAKNAALFLGIFDFLGIVIFQKRGYTLYTRTLYSTFNSYGEVVPFVLASIFLSTSKIEKFKRNLKVIGGKSKYKVEAFGRSLGPVLLRFGRESKTVKQF